jgi:hypothetical protein
MKKIIRLTESDLVRIVKKVMKTRLHEKNHNDRFSLLNEQQFSESQKCKLEGDNRYIYAKDTKGWWTSTNGGQTWIHLPIPKYQEAVNKLNGECPNGSGVSKDFSEDRICRLQGETKWIYSKGDNETWWASRDGGNKWFKLSPIKFKESIDKLEKNCPTVKGDCKTKCNAKHLLPGQTGPQVQGWFYGSVGCYEATGSGGFSTKEECDACKCADKIG